MGLKQIIINQSERAINNDFFEEPGKIELQIESKIHVELQIEFMGGSIRNLLQL